MLEKFLSDKINGTKNVLFSLSRALFGVPIWTDVEYKTKEITATGSVIFNLTFFTVSCWILILFTDSAFTDD